MKYTANKILLIITRQIGDVLLATPLLHSLRKAYPQAQIDVLVYQGKQSILEGNTDCNKILTIVERPNFAQSWKLFKRIFRQYDLALSTLAGDRPTFYSLLAAPKRVNIVPSRHWKNQWKRWIAKYYTELDDEHTHTVIQYLRLADLLDIPRSYKVILPYSAQTASKLDKYFHWQTEPFVVLHLVPMWHYKRWTLMGWQQLAHYFTQQNLRVVLTGSHTQSEMEYIQQAISLMPTSVINLAGQLDLSDVAQLIQVSRLYIGPDTAVTHLAAATDTPIVALYGPTNPLKWAPFPKDYQQDKTPFQKVGIQQVNNVLLIQGKKDCVPCHQEGCQRHRQSQSDCLEELQSQTVIERIQLAFKL